MIFEWQMAAWFSLNAKRKQLPHALLVSVPAVLGKSGLADAFAQSLLCDRPKQDGLHCETCQACNWYAQGNHPDFRRLQPESMAPEAEDEPASRKEKKKSDQIRIEQVRALDDFLAVGTHRGGARVILIDPADAMNTVAQSALLKSLEEPPPGTHYLLVTSRPQRLLATIRSRCMRCPIALPGRHAAVSWLAGEGMSDAGAALDAAAGAPLAALAAAGAEGARKAFLARLADPAMDPLSLAQTCESVEPAVLVGWLQRYQWWLIGASVLAVVVVNMRNFRRGAGS